MNLANVGLGGFMRVQENCGGIRHAADQPTSKGALQTLHCQHINCQHINHNMGIREENL